MTKKESYLVEGMTCAGCERTISRVVGNINGVIYSKANLSSSSVDVEYDPSKVDIDKIKNAVNSVGYKFVGQNPVNGQRTGNDQAVK